MLRLALHILLFSQLSREEIRPSLPLAFWCHMDVLILFRITLRLKALEHLVWERSRRAYGRLSLATGSEFLFGLNANLSPLLALLHLLLKLKLSILECSKLADLTLLEKFYL